MDAARSKKIESGRRKNGGAPPSRRIRSNGSSAGRYVTQRSVTGGRMNMPDNPPDVISQPWNHITLVFMVGAEKVTVGNLVDRFLEQFDPATKLVTPRELWIHPDEAGHAWRNVGGSKPGQYTVNVSGPNFTCKVHSVRIWNLTGRAVSLTVYDYSNASQSNEALIGVVDTGGINRFPAVGYSLPLSLRGFVVRSGDTGTSSRAVFETTCGTGDRCMAYVRIEWRCDGPSQVPKYVLAPNERLHQDVSKNTKALGDLIDMQKDANAGINKLVDAQPSTLRKVFNGAVETAAFVAPLVLEDAGANVSGIPELFERMISLEEKLRKLETKDEQQSVSSFDEI